MELLRRSGWMVLILGGVRGVMRDFDAKGGRETTSRGGLRAPLGRVNINCETVVQLSLIRSSGLPHSGQQAWTSIPTVR